MDKKQFQLSVQLYNTLGETILRSGNTLSSELCLGHKISLWEVVATYLVLYRFPLLFPSNGKQSASQNRLKHYYRPLRGLAAHFRDYVISMPRRKTGCTDWPEGSPPVLFLCFVPTFYRDVLRPVAESLVTKKDLQAVVIGQGQNHGIITVTDERLRFHSIWEHWDDDSETMAKAMLNRLEMLKKALLNKAQLELLIRNVKDYYSKLALSSEFYWLFWREFKRLIPQVAVAYHILEQHKPALIISADDADQRCRIYSLLARLVGIPSLLVQQGFSTRDYPEWSFFSHDVVAAMGQSSWEDMIAQGVPAEKITITGHPGFDNFVLPEPDACARLRSKLGISDGQKMILFASQPYYVGIFNTPHIRRVMIEAIIKSTGSLDNIKLVVKPHPGESAQELKALIGKAPHVVIVDKTMDISRLIKASDVLITFFSQVGLQALYAGKPVINVDFPGSGGNSLYLKSGTTWAAHSAEEITAHIRNLTGEARDREMAGRETERQHFLREMVCLPDGQATARVVQVILNMMH
jgi:UDP-N-acetylglucosamine:LPS N-acetylglucosamine transferase